MKKTAASALLAVTAALLAAPAYASPDVAELSISTGRRVDNLDWNIAGPIPFPPFNSVNVLSELFWSDIESQEVRGLLRVFFDRFYVKGEAGFGFITGGRNRDSDYRGDDRTLEYSRSENAADDGTVWDLSAGLGYVYEFPALGGGLELIPMAGFSYHKQNLTLTDGVQTIDTVNDPPQLGPFPGLDSTFEAGWAGPWAGAEIAYRSPGGKLRLFGNFEFHAVYYNAKGNWNLRSTFAHPVSFEHWATGNGIVFSGGAEYNIARNWSFTAAFVARDFRAADGTDRTYFFDGTATDTPLNEVNWDSKSAFFGFNYRF